MKFTGYSPEEEKANSWTHVVGVVYGFAGIFITLLMSNSAKQQGSTLIFFATVMILYGSSSLYHYATGKKQKSLFKKLDHISIYLLIAGTFTPFCFAQRRTYRAKARARHMGKRPFRYHIQDIFYGEV